MNSGPSLPPVDPKDPRIRYTLADVAMRVAMDGPMYGVIVLVGVLAMKGITSPEMSIAGSALALLARSRPPDDRKHPPGVGVALGVAGALAAAAAVVACV